MRTLILLLLFSSSCFAQMPIGGVTAGSSAVGVPTVVQSNGKMNNNSTTAAVSLSLAIAAGDTIVVLCGVNQTTTCTVADSLNGTFGAAKLSEKNTNGAFMYLFVLTNSLAGASDTVTCTAAASGNTACFSADITHSTALDQSNGSIFTTATTTPASPNVTTTAANEVIIGGFGANSATVTTTAGTGYTLFTNGSQGGSIRSFGAEFKTVSSTGSYSAGATFSSSSQGITIIATFK